MKPKLFLLACASLLLSLNLNAQDQLTQVTPKNKLYQLRFNNLKIGNPAYAQMVMETWKLYDNNEVDAINSIFTDDAVGYFPDGTVVKGAENLLNLFRETRNSFASIKEEVYACTTLESSNDPEHEFVVIWGKETDTKKDGSIQRSLIHEVWQFNHEGMVDEARQYVISEKPGTALEQMGSVKSKGQGYPIMKNLSAGNPAYSDIVLRVWKDFENNSMDNSRPYFADNVVAHSSSGEIATGKENVFKISSGFRNTLSAVKFEISACTTFKSPADREHEVVMIWAESSYTLPDGNIQKFNEQEAWYFNKQGKIDKVYQFAASVASNN